MLDEIDKKFGEDNVQQVIINNAANYRQLDTFDRKEKKIYFGLLMLHDTYNGFVKCHSFQLYLIDEQIKKYQLKLFI